MYTRGILDSDQSILMIIDMQERFLSAIPDFDDITGRVLILLEAASVLDMPVVITRQYPKGLGDTVERIREALIDTAAVFDKTTFSAMAEPKVAQHLASLGRKQVLVTGIETHVCVNQTVHDLLAHGYEPHLMTDATSSRDEVYARVAYEKMRKAGAVPSCVEMALFEMIKDSQHTHFKSIQKLIK